MRKIIQIVPKLPPTIDGVGDYSLNLARQLREDFSIETCFVVGSPTWFGSCELEGFPILQVKKCSSKSLLSLLQSHSIKTVLLHYVGYGYASRGAPIWLIQGLERWRNNLPDAYLTTMFHEIYASGYPVWTSSFWVSPLQKFLAMRLAVLSDSILTSLQDYAKLLYNLSNKTQANIATLPVFSTIGEPSKQLPLLEERQRRMVIFGSKTSRMRAYQECLSQLSEICLLLKLEEIWDIGARLEQIPSNINGVPVLEKGHCADREISHMLLTSFAGFIYYDLRRLAKSTIFAAYSAHGLLPVCSGYEPYPIDAIDGTKAGQHYWTLDGHTKAFKDLATLQIIAINAHAWYKTHSLPVQAQTFEKYLGKPV